MSKIDLNKKSNFNYKKAGGYYIASESQYGFVKRNLHLFITDEEKKTANLIIVSFEKKAKIFHDHIHIVNDKIRKIRNQSL